MGFEQFLLAELEERYSACIKEDKSLSDLPAEKAARELGREEFNKALFGGYYIKRCRLCGKLFVTRYSKAVYCKELYEGKSRCKDVGARIVRGSDPVTREFDNARRLHLRRRKTALGIGDLTANARYEDWLKFAQKKERECRTGRLTTEEFSAAVGKNYTEDMRGKR